MVGLATKKQILIVGNDGLNVYVTSGKSVSLYAEISAYHEDLVSELTAVLSTVNLPLVVLFDVVEQQYRKEILPQVNFMDKGKVIQRKLQMAFPQQKMRNHILMKNPSGENNGLTVLFSAVSESDLTTVVMQAILDSAVPVTGAGLLPLEATPLITKLVQEAHKRAQTPDDTRWSVLMTYHKTGGLRQVVIRDGELALTRITPLAAGDGGGAQIADEMAREFNATLTYLSRFGYVAADGLDLMVVSSPDVCERLRQYGLAVTHLYPVTLAESGQLAGVGNITQDRDYPYADVLYAAWIGQQGKLALPLQSSFLGKVKIARQATKFATIFLILVSLYVIYQCVTLQMHNMSGNSGTGGLLAQNRQLKQEVDELSASLNTLKYDPEKTGSLLNLYDEYQKQDITLDPTLDRLLAQVDYNQYHITDMVIAEVTTDEALTLQQSAMDAQNLKLQQDAMAAQEAAAASQDGMMEPLAAAPSVEAQVAKPVVEIRATLTFVPDMTVEEAARATYDFIEKLQTAFPGRVVELTDIVGNLSENKTVEVRGDTQSSASEQSSNAELVSKFTLKGMLE